MKQNYTITVLSKNRAGLLNRITIIFSRRKINIDSISVSESQIRNVFQHTILVHETEDTVRKISEQIEKQVDVYKAFYYTSEETVHQDLALFKISTKNWVRAEGTEQITRQFAVRILTVEKDFIVLEKTGHTSEIQELLKELNQFGVLEFVRSGRVAISKPMKELKEYLSEMEKESKNK